MNQEIPPEVMLAVQASANDIAELANMLDRVAWVYGGDQFVNYVRQEVKYKELMGMATIDAIHEVYKSITRHKEL